MAEIFTEKIRTNNGFFNQLHNLYINYFTTDVIIFLGYLLISFLNAWDFLDRPTGAGDYTGLGDMNALLWILYTRPIMQFLTGSFLLMGSMGYYWGLFIFNLLLAVSFYYVGKKLKMDSLWIFSILLTLPLMRYGVLDYGGRDVGILGLAMVWIYFFKRQDKKKSYILVSIIGFFTREYCLYVNIFFVIESFLDGIGFNNIKDVFKDLKPRIMRTLKTNTFEIGLCIAYIIYRTILTSVIGGINQFDYGMFNLYSEGEHALTYFLTHPKLWVVMIFIYGMLWLVLIKYPDLKVYTLITFVVLFSSLFGLIWEIDKIGNIFMIIAFELLTPRIWLNQNKRIAENIDTKI
jgi:hypothetical protein